MRTSTCGWTAIVVGLFVAVCHGQGAVNLPGGVKAVWDLSKASREGTGTRERVCINGLWRWQPGKADSDAVPSERWGYFKVPGAWPGITDYMQKDCQTVWAHPSWKDQRLSSIGAAWYQREIEIPKEWEERRIALSAEYVNSFAVVYVDGKKVGEMRFPGGELDLSAICRAGGKYVLSMHVVAMPLKAVMMSFSDSAAAKEIKGSVARRGLCGDVYLVSTPAKERIENVSATTSVRRGEIAFGAAVHGLAADGQYSLGVRIKEWVPFRKGELPFIAAEFKGKAFKAADLVDGQISETVAWKAKRMWDVHTPENIYEMEISLLDSGGKVLDRAEWVRFGHRELWIDGRDFYLNGSRIYLSAVPLDNAQVGAAWASYDGARESLLRLKSIGINFVYTHNYGCEPGTHLSFEEILRAADDVGMLVALSQPHFGQYDWKRPNADAENGYAQHAAFYAKVAGNHPSVVFYSMSHNATGYSEDMNPDMIAMKDPREGSGALNNAKSALRAQAIVNRLDPTRIVYHHAGGNIGSMHTANFYPNFAPIQELSDWFGPWAANGTKPMFLCEYGAPFTWDWTMYRGWYQGKREFGSAVVPWEFCMAEWNAQFLGDRAFAITEMEKQNLRWEDAQFKAGKVWHRWDYPTDVGSPKFADRQEVMAMYLADNWRAYRTWGVSGISPWEYSHFWTPREEVDRSRKELKVDWEHLQRPGLSADYLDRRYERIDLAFDLKDWVRSAAGKALLRNNQEVLAHIAGKGEAFTSKDHDYRAGEVVEKQLVVINNTRKTVAFDCEWSLGLPRAVGGKNHVTVETGQQVRIPIKVELPANVGTGAYELKSRVRFGDEEQDDRFVIHVLPAPDLVGAMGRVALFDPKGETAKLLEKMGVVADRVGADADLSRYDVLVVGKMALSVDGTAPDVSRVREGLKVIVFEQASNALEKRLGFRVVEYGLRRVFKRIGDHPVLAGIEDEDLRDWRGEGTTTSPRLAYEMQPMHGPTIRWCDIPVSRVWRCGNRGNVASVLIEKPARGDFRPILDGGYSLQYSPLMEYREGKGVILFCQLDVTGRSESEPAGENLVGNLLRYVGSWRGESLREAVYVGEEAGLKHLQAIGVKAVPLEKGKLNAGDVLVLGPGCGERAEGSAGMIKKFVADGGRVLGIGLEQRDVDAVLPFKVTMKNGEHINAVFDGGNGGSLIAEVGPADVEMRGPRKMALVAGGAEVIGDGVLGIAPVGGKGNVVLCQVVPWGFDYSKQYNLKRTYRRASFLVTRLLGNLGVAEKTPMLERFGAPARAGEKRWSEGLYLDQPEEWDDPYRFFRW